LHDDDAVLPVIEVILMVAITVILAAVIASFVLGLGNQANQSSPTATTGMDYDADSSLSGDADGVLIIFHDGGDPINENELYVRGDFDGSTDVASANSRQDYDPTTRRDRPPADTPRGFTVVTARPKTGYAVAGECTSPRPSRDGPAGSTTRTPSGSVRGGGSTPPDNSRLTCRSGGVSRGVAVPNRPS